MFQMQQSINQLTIVNAILFPLIIVFIAVLVYITYKRYIISKITFSYFRKVIKLDL